MMQLLQIAQKVKKICVYSTVETINFHRIQFEQKILKFDSSYRIIYFLLFFLCGSSTDDLYVCERKEKQKIFF